MRSKRKTKIVATIGPASTSPMIIKMLIDSGANIFRFNLKHGTPESHELAIKNARGIAKKLRRKVDILLDMPSSASIRGIKLAENVRPEYIAVSYVKRADEIVKLKDKLSRLKISSNVVTKIETNEALNYFQEIISNSQSLMIARGDLGESIPLEQLPFVQKEIIASCKQLDKLVIVATEMLLSMVLAKKPSRAEASDVANAVLEGADAVMLSEETAIGNNPVEAVKIMDKIIYEAESWQKHGHLHIYSSKKKKFLFGG